MQEIMFFDSHNAVKIRSFLNLKLLKFLVILTAFNMAIKSQSKQYNVLTSMQQTNQTFMSYIPYIQSCDYTSPFITPGYITSFQTSPKNIFSYYQNAERIAFWSSIENGLDIYLAEDQLLKIYDGIIFRPQIFNQDENNISINSTNDIVPLFNTFMNGNLTIYFVQVTVQKDNNFTLTQTVVKTLQMNISSQLNQLIANCKAQSSTEGQEKIVISQLDNNHFIGSCLNSSQIFMFTLNETSPNDTIIDLSQYNLSMPINNMILNPILQILGINELGWNVFLLANNSQQTYSCNFNPLTPLNFTCLDSTELSEQFLALIEKLWSEQDSVLQVKLQKLMTHIGPNATQKFPGKINSIFIDIDDNVFVQSQKDGLSYLSIYDWQKQHVLNISFKGTALLYNGLQFLVKTTENISEYTIMSVTLPMLSYGINDVVNESFSITLSCSDDVGNLEINYDIFMSNIDFPSSYTFQTKEPNLYSALSIYTFQLMDYYSVFGPGYTVYYKGPDVLSATLLDASIVSMSTYVLSIIEIIVTQATSNTIFKASSMIYTTQNSIYIYKKGQNLHTLVLSNPCGIKNKLKGMKVNNFQTLYYGYKNVGISGLTYCLCKAGPKIANNCEEVNKSAVKTNVMKAPTKLSQKIQKLQKLGLMNNRQKQQISLDKSVTQNTSQFINNRLFTIVDQQLIVTLFNNGSAVLSNFLTKQFYDITTVDCGNKIVGTIFVKQFYDPTLFLFCQQAGYIYQYKIRSNKFIFNRVIPLYGFKTRANSATNLLVGNSYIFIEVDVDQNPNVSSSINVNPLNTYCCVLRIDPYADTVSTIKQVIFATNVQEIYQQAGIDVAYYKGSSVTEDDSFLKIYLDQTWLALNLTQPEQAIQSFDFDIVFASINYNLASQFSVNITYNMTEMILTQKNQPIDSPIFLQQVIQPINQEHYTNTISFNYNGITGPIVSSNISSNIQSEIIEDLEMNDLIVQRKILGTIGKHYLQIMTPMQGKSNTTFDRSIIVVGENQIQVYLKNYLDQEMFPVKTFTLNYTNCLYLPYNIINSTSIQFVSQCMFPELNSSQIPILNMTLTMDNQTPPQLTANLYLGSITLNLNNLTNLKTLVFQNQTYILGMNQGPMQSLTGRLQYCSSNGLCSALYISSKEEFLLYYDIFTFAPQQFIIVTLDFQSIQVWLDLNPPTQSTSDSFIQSNYTINISQYVNDNISIITLINANQTSFSAVLSGALAYYEVVYIFGQEIEILSAFQRYGNCQQFDRFPVSVLLDDNKRIEALIAECSQNQNVLRLQTYERINSTEIVIYTGYLQYYTRSGPLSNMLDPLIPSYNPIRILRLSNTMLSKLFLLYQNDKNQIKLVYQQIDGILADNYVHLQPSLQITLSPLTTNLVYPMLSFFIENDCYMLHYMIETKSVPIDKLTSTETAFLIIFIICNVFSVVVMVFFYIYQKQKQPKKVTESQSNGKTWTDNYEPTIISLKQFKDKFKQRVSGISVLSTRKQSHLRKQTQIQLFTTRSK